MLGLLKKICIFMGISLFFTTPLFAENVAPAADEGSVIGAGAEEEVAPPSAPAVGEPSQPMAVPAEEESEPEAPLEGGVDAEDF